MDSRRIQRYAYVPLWREAISRCIPEYPSISLAGHHEGVAVVQLDVSRAGNIDRFEVLQAPDEAIVRSVETCRSQFRPAPQPGAKPGWIRRGKLFYYFVITGDRGEVFAANDPEQKSKLISRGGLRK